MAALPDGGFVAVWQSHGGQDGDTTGIYGQRFDCVGNRVGSEILVNTTTDGQQQYPAVGVASDGKFTIAWQSSLQDRSGFGIFAQRFEGNCQPEGDEFQVNTTTNDDQVYPSLAYNDHGGFVIAWNGKGSGDSNGVFIREYDAEGMALADESLVNGTTDNAQKFATVAAAGSGYVVAWSGKGAGDSDGVFLRRLGSGPTVAEAEDLSLYTGCASTSVDLWSMFEDAEDADATLRYQVTGDTNPGLFTSVQIDPGTHSVKLDFPVGALGTAGLTLRATDPGGLYVEATFSVTVACPAGDPILYWYPQGGPKEWSTNEASWNDRSDGLGNQYYWYNDGYTAVFGYPDDTVSVVGSVTFDEIQFTATGYAIEAGTSGVLSPSSTGTGTITVGTGCSATISCDIGGTESLTKAGDGTLILSGDNDYAGGTTISAGNLTFSDSGAIPAGTDNILIESGGALDVTGAYGTVTDWLGSGKIAAVSEGALALTGSGAIAIDISSYGNFTGLCIGAAPGSSREITSLTPAGNTYRLGGGNGTLTVSDDLENFRATRSVFVNGNVVLSGDNTYSGGTTINAGNLVFANADAVPAGSGNILISAGGTLNVGPANDFDTVDEWLGSGKIRADVHRHLGVRAAVPKRSTWRATPACHWGR